MRKFWNKLDDKIECFLDDYGHVVVFTIASVIIIIIALIYSNN